MSLNVASKKIEQDLIVKRTNAESYERNLEKNALRNAVGSGYFKALTIDDLLGRAWRGAEIGEQEDDELTSLEEKTKRENLKIEKIELLNFNLYKLRSIGPLGLCINLTVCNISGNYVTRIDALQACRNLVKLDAHRNQIQELPAEVFWSELACLQVVYLHDNGIPSFDEIKKMCSSENVWMLSLFDTPVSLKMHYRHFTTNSIWSLKVLDNIIISDEEIIEDAKFHQRFKALQPQFVFKPKSLACQDHCTLSDERRGLQEDLAFVNKAQAKYSPVLIIQRYIRGYLARSRFCYEKERRLWAAVTIQRFYRDFKRLEMPECPIDIDASSYLTLTSQRIDYDTYIKYRRSRHRSNQSGTALASFKIPMEESLPRVVRKDQPSHTADRTLKIHVDLKELETSTSKIIDESSLLDESVSEITKRSGLRASKKCFSGKVSQQKPTSFDLVGNFTAKNIVQLDREIKQKEKDDTLKQGLEKHRYERREALNEEEGKVPFRLSGIHAPRLQGDLLDELTRDIVNGARDIRSSIKAFEDSMHKKAPPVVERHYPITNDQKLYIRTHGTIALSCFRAVDQAYRDRDRTKTMMGKISQVRSIKEKRELSCRMRDHNKFSSIKKIHSEKNDAAAELMQVMEDCKSEADERRELVFAERNRQLKRESQRRKDRAFATEFVCQNNAISKALVNHASAAAKEQAMQAKAEKTLDIRKDIHRQKEIIKRYTEHRNLLLQSEVSLSRSKLDNDLILRAIEQERETRLQVKKLKKQKESKRGASAPSLVTAPNRLPPLAVIADTQLKRWESLPKKDFRPREHDRVDIWLS